MNINKYYYYYNIPCIVRSVIYVLKTAHHPYNYIYESKLYLVFKNYIIMFLCFYL